MSPSTHDSVPNANGLPMAGGWRPRTLRHLQGYGDTRLGRWQTLLRDPWDRPTADERPYRIAAWIISLLVNAVFALMAIYFMYLQYMGSPPPEPEQVTTQVEFIGRGNALEGGGDLQPSQQASVATSASAEAATAAPSASRGEPQAQASSSAEPTPSVPTEVTVSTPQPDPSPLQIPVSSVAAPTAQVAPISAPQRQFTERDIGDPLAPVRVELPAQGTSTTATPTLSMPSRSLDERRVANPSPAAAVASNSTPAAPSNTVTGTSASSTPSTGPSPASTGASGTASSTGPRVDTAPGGWYSDRGSTDLGNSSRNRDGSRVSGNDLFDEQGKPKLPYKGSASRNDPPGMFNGEIRDLDRAGTWRKRRPTDSGVPGSNMVWRPSETVLQELVRRGVKELNIRIPGTSTTIRCKISLLALGGGCGITDPRLQDQEATARPSPEFEFKPELNEHNGGRRTDQKVEDFGPGAILPGQEIKKQVPTAGPAPIIADPKRPQFKFGDD